MKFSRWAERSDIAADRLGEHNEAVLRELLSLTDQEIAGLYADKVILRDPLLDPPEKSAMSPIWDTRD